MKIVFLPTEVLNRELTARAFLSTKLANNGNKVYVFEHTFLIEMVGMRVVFI